MPHDITLPDASILRAHAELDQLWRQGTRFLGVRVAILGGAMSWVSERTLASVISNAGGFGVIAGGSMSPDQFAAEIAATQAMTSAPFGVNFITIHPQLQELIRVCLQADISHIVLAGGISTGGAVRAFKDGARLICLAPALVLARRLVRSGADASIIEGSEAGGHIGPVSLSVLAQEILPHLREVPVSVAGGLGRGEAVLGYLEQGAVGAQLGTLFAAAVESVAHSRFKQALVQARAQDAVASTQLDEHFAVTSVRSLTNAGTRLFLSHQAETSRRHRDGMVTVELPVAEIIGELVSQAVAALATRGQRYEAVY